MPQNTLVGRVVYRSPILRVETLFAPPHGAALRPDRGHGGRVRSPPTQRVCDGEPESQGAPGGRVAA